MKTKISPDFLDENVILISALFSEILKHSGQVVNGFSKKMYLDSADVKRLLNISDSTYYRMRKENRIPTVRIGKKIYCPAAYFMDLMKEATENIKSKKIKITKTTP